ncbi:MAG: ABC transporter permease [Acholeplasmatales bacterium]
MKENKFKNFFRLVGEKIVKATKYLIKEYKILKEKEGYKKFVASLLAIALGLLIGIILIIINKPGQALVGIWRLLRGPLNNPFGFWSGIGQLLYRSTPLIFTGLAVAFAFKTGVFNIGASGQYMVGLFAAAIVGILGDSLGFMQWPVAVLCGALAGAIWGMIPGVFKAYFNVNVVITGIMFNYIGMFFINGMLDGPLKSKMVNQAQNRTIAIDQNARTPYFFLDKIFPYSGADVGIILAIIAVIIIYFILNKTVFGRELKSVGYNQYAAKYAGVAEKKAIILSMTISGLLAGVGGALFILAPSIFNLGNTYAVESVVLQAGFDGIPIALLGNSSPIGVLFSALFISYIKQSDLALQSIGISSEMVNMVVAIILYFSAFSLIVSQYAARFLKKRKEEKAQRLAEKETLEEEAV